MIVDYRMGVVTMRRSKGEKGSLYRIKMPRSSLGP